MEWYKAPFIISTAKERIDVAFVHRFLTTSYWAAGIPVETVRRSTQGSMAFGVYEGDEQVGFARVITDGATFAYLADVFIAEDQRGRCLSAWLMECILSHPDLQGLRRFLLATQDAHRLYRKFGFEALVTLEPWMQVHDAEVYSREM